MGMEHSVEASLGTDVEAPISQHRHDLSRRQCGEFRLVRSEQDALAFFFAEAVSHVAVAALATVDAIAVTSKLTAPTLQRGEPYPQQTRDCGSPCTGCCSSLKNLQGFAAIC
jgi:hypothetical protein